MTNCMQCGENYEPKRSTGLYCSGACRVKAHRNANKEITQACNAKRGKDIKCFADLPPDVQETINLMSQRAGKIDPIEKANRTAIAVNYQRLFLGRYYPISTYHSPQDAAVTGKPGDEDYNGVCTDEWINERKGPALQNA